MDPLTTPPWNSETRIEEFRSQEADDLARIKMLLKADNALRMNLKLPEETSPEERLSPLDLKLENLGRRNESLVLLDYVNQRFEECVNPEKSVIKRAAMNNSYVETHLIEWAESESLSFILNPIEARGGIYLSYDQQNSICNQRA